MEDPDQRLKQLQGCQSMFNTTPALKKNVPYVDEYIKLVKKQKEIVVRFHTLSQTHTQQVVSLFGHSALQYLVPVPMGFDCVSSTVPLPVLAL